MYSRERKEMSVTSLALPSVKSRKIKTFQNLHTFQVVTDDWDVEWLELTFEIILQPYKHYFYIAFLKFKVLCFRNVHFWKNRVY